MKRKFQKAAPVWLPAFEETSTGQGYSWAWAGAVLVLFGMFLLSRPKNHFSMSAQMPASDTRWDKMVCAIREMADGYDGEVGLYIKDLKTGRTYERNADQRFVCASLIKLPIMAAIFEAIKSGQVSLNTRIRYKRSLRREGSGHLKWARMGARFPVSYLVYEMITKSDNTATAMLIDMLGYDYLNTQFEKFGLQATRIAPTGMSLSSSLDPALDNYTTPREMGSLLEKIYKHQVASDGLSDLMIEVMKGANSHSRLAVYLPQDWKLARKTGLLRKNCHDVGIVFAPEGDYILCVLTGQNGDYKKAKGLIASVGRTTYEYLGHS